MKTAINWFEIPVVDFERAFTFYSEVMGELRRHDMPDPNVKYAVFPYEPGQGVGGAIMKMDGATPSTDGVTIYLHAGDDLTGHLERAEKAGAKVLVGKTSIGENGYMAQLIDTEGNRIALHSMN